MTQRTEAAKTDWLNTCLPIGAADGDQWTPAGCGVLLVDGPLVWLVTARANIEREGERLLTWVPGKDGPGLLDLSDSQARSGISWLHHQSGVSATLFPVDQRFAIKAFNETQCTRLRHVQPLQPVATAGFLYGPDLPPPQSSPPALCDGIVSSVDKTTGWIHATAPTIPRNLGAPLLLASPYGGNVTLAGILIGDTLINDEDPRALPLRFSRAICIDAAIELIRSEAANEQRRKVTADACNPPEES